MKAIRVHTIGGPEVLKYEEVPRPSPGPGQALVRIEAVGVNFIEIYQRTGLYQVQVPFIPGTEAAGTVVEIGAKVTAVTDSSFSASGGEVLSAGNGGPMVGFLVGISVRPGG